MSYTNTSIARTIDQINSSLYLPAIQRPYVWDPKQIIALFDSLLKGYPISSFLFWKIEKNRRSDWEIYKFFENFKQGETHNEQIDPDGREITLVLDGQQRLTSLLIGLSGSYTVKRKHSRRDNPNAWFKQKLYIDLLKSPTEFDDEGDADLGVTYGLKFFEGEPQQSVDHCWFKVGRILDCSSDDLLDSLVDEIDASLTPEATRKERRIVEKNLERLYRVVWKDEIISFYTEMDQSIDRVLDIFIRANDGGTKLSKSDLLLSMITSKWSGTSARQEIFDLVDYLNDGLQARNSLSKDFIMKSCLVLCEFDVVYKVNNFTNANLATIEENWPQIKKSLERTIRLVNSFGIDKETLSSTNALLPIAYYIHQIDQGLDGSTGFDVTNSTKIHKFLLGSILNRVFGFAGDSAVTVCRSIIRDKLRNSNEFPLEGLASGLVSKGRFSSFNAQSLENLWDDNLYGKRTCFLALSLIYDTHNWGHTSHHIDHIIPKSVADRNSLMAQNISEARIQKILDCVNRPGNLELLLGRENLEKNDTPFNHWIETRDESFLERHLIPQDRSLWTVERLPEFVQERERLMTNKVQFLDREYSDRTDTT